MDSVPALDRGRGSQRAAALDKESKTRDRPTRSESTGLFSRKSAAAKPPRAQRSGRRGVSNGLRTRGSTNGRHSTKPMRHATSTSALPRASSFKATKGLHKSASAATVVGGATAPTLPQLPEPKVFVPHEQPPGAVPRQVQVERKKRHYAEQDIAQLLELSGVPELKRAAATSTNPMLAKLPLDEFDSLEYDIRPPAEWITSAPQGTPARGLADAPHGNTWRPCTARAYDEATKRFQVMWDDSGGEAQLPRLDIVFAVEDPFMFAKRVAAAHKRRNDAAALMLYNLYVDCMPTEDAPSLSDEDVDHVVALAINTKQLRAFAVDIQELVSDIQMDYARTMNKIVFNHHHSAAQASPAGRSYSMLAGLAAAPGATLSESTPPESGVVPVPSYDFPLQFNHFSFHTFYTQPEVISAAVRCAFECTRMGDTSFLSGALTKSSRLEEFDHLQMTSIHNFTTGLKESWAMSVKTHIRTCLKDVGKGWFNTNETSSEVYKFSKLRRFLMMVNFMMEDTLRNVVTKSLHAYADGIATACEGVVTVRSPNSVIVDLSSSDDPLRRRRMPMFTTDLEVVAVQAEGAAESGDAPATTAQTFAYIHPVKRFEEVPLAMFDLALSSLRLLTKVERLLMENLFWSDEPVMEVVRAVEPWVQGLRRGISDNLHRATQPLFDKYKGVLALDLDAFMSDIAAAHTPNPDLPALRALIRNHQEAHAAVLVDVPESINLGLFTVVTSTVRAHLADKHGELCQRLLSFVAKSAHTRAKSLTESFDGINSRLGTFPQNIEQLVELKEYMATVPQKVRELSAGITKMWEAYDLTEEFLFKIPKAEFVLSWTVFGRPKKVQQRIRKVRFQMEQEKSRYHEEMKDQQARFESLLIILHQEVVGFSRYDDLAKVDIVADHVAKVKNKIRNAVEQARLFNNREALFGQALTPYDNLATIQKIFEPYQMVWETADNWFKWHKQWMEGVFSELDAQLLEKRHLQCLKHSHRCVKAFEASGNAGCHAIAKTIKSRVVMFKPHVPLVIALRNPGMRDRHWDELSRTLGFSVNPNNPHFTLARAFELGLPNSKEAVAKIAERAGKEYHIEQALDKMEFEWSTVRLQIEPYRETKTYILKGVDDLQALLDDHVNMTQAMAYSAFKAPFAERIDAWSETLNTVSDVLDEWIKVQRAWLYLQPIFDSDDIQKQLPTETKRFGTVDKNWRHTLVDAKSRPQAIRFCANEKLLERFQESNKFLDMVQKGLSDYLETKRAAFARFYFLSNDELLEILSQTKDPQAVQPHLKKCFEGIRHVTFNEAGNITDMRSGEGEVVTFVEPVKPRNKNVEVWMNEVEAAMRTAVHAVLARSITDYQTRKRTEWVQMWPGQCVLNVSQLFWTEEVERGMEVKGLTGVRSCYEHQLKQLEDMVALVRGELGKLARVTLSALTVVDVHARDVTRKLLENRVHRVRDFEWISQMRYYWQEDGGASPSRKSRMDMFIMMVSSRRPYGYEYLGNTLRLVITPLTDKCYLTLMGALQLNLGGAPAGPAGTGKTETTKDLAKGLAKQCVVFNCSDGLDYLAMGKFFKGLASCGAWACFDEFNRIDVEVLSVVAQQIMTLQDGVNRGVSLIMFEDSEITLDGQFAVFITMNPGYAGRTELPDNLKALFRPVAMMVPDYALIGEIMLFSFGFSKGLVCAQKMVATFTLCSEQLSSQDHYDYGMRAVKTVITAAGNLKRQHPDQEEEELLLRALLDVNLPKFLSHDIPLFKGIMNDLFPGVARPNIDYGDLRTAISIAAERKGLQAVQSFVTSCIQLYETIVVRHGLMVVGPTGGGKTEIISVLADALILLRIHDIPGNRYERVKTFVMNPKAVTMGQLYGEFDANTHEWSDGILANTVRECARSTTPELKWVIFDGPVDAIWIENMNTVLDDNKKLCLVSGEIIGLSPETEVMFEVEDLAVASPATVSRCGMVYTEPSSLGLSPLLTSWLERLPKCLEPRHRAQLALLFDTYLFTGLRFLRRNIVEPVPTVDNSLCNSLTTLLDCALAHLTGVATGAREPPSAKELDELALALQPLFIFCFVWSVGATANAAGRQRWDRFLRAQMDSHGARSVPPDDALVYDYFYVRESDQWVPWMTTVPRYEHDARMSFAELIIPTKDSVRYKAIARQLLVNQRHVLFTGVTGTGKTVNIVDLISSGLPKVYVPLTLTFSAQTSANQTQDIVDGKLEKRQRGVYGPTAGHVNVLFVDDLNMPKREKYFAQPPIELLRQWCDYGGWYDRHERTFRRVIDTVLIAAMGPPGGGRNPITPRLLRHFNLVNYTEMDDESLYGIFTTILANFLVNFDDSISSLTAAVVRATVHMYNTLVAEMLPAPSKPHYTFNLRDLGKVFQGLLMASPAKTPTQADFARLWVHETRRVFQDRLINETDKAWLDTLQRSALETVLGLKWASVVTESRVIYGDYMVPGADPKIYEQVPDLNALVPTIEEYLLDFNAESKTPMKLVMFLDAIEHVSRISRVLRQPQGNALLIGVGGSGRQSLTRLATFIADYELFQIEITKGYGPHDWREDLKQCLMKAGLDDVPVVFLFNDAQIAFESMLEDVNNVLNAGDVPTLYAPEDMDRIITTCRRDCLARRLPPTKINIFSQYLLRVRKNIHVVVCMSPMGAEFRDRLRMFPSLVNCCTIDWFSEWPEEALVSVALSALTEENLTLYGHTENCVQFFQTVHQGVAKASAEYHDTLRRYNYVTPTSYLEVLATFKQVLKDKRAEVDLLRQRLGGGLQKLHSAQKQVAVLQKQLETMRPKLIVTQQEVEQFLVVIERDKEAAAETKVVVEKEEKEAQTRAAETKAIAMDAEKDLAEALPALDKAVACLNRLRRADLDEVRAMKKPPQGVKLTMHAACIMFEIKPVLKKDNENLGRKLKDYWEAATKTLLTDANKFLNDMKAYDKDHIRQRVISEIEPFMTMPEFTPEMVEKSSRACSGICIWVRAMFKYYHVALQVEPKKQRLAEAQASLDKTMAALHVAKSKLREVEEKILELQRQYEASVAQKEQLATDIQLCEDRLQRAQKLVGGLGGEQHRWTETVETLGVTYKNLLGDALVSSSCIAYVGAFTSDFRARLVAAWQVELLDLGIPHTRGCDLQSTLADPVQVRAWGIAGLPSDSHSVENGIIMAKARRWPLLIDPQGQANQYIKNMGKEAENGMDILRLTEKNFLRSLENGIRFGKWVLLEDVGQTLDATLEPVLLQQKFQQGGTTMIRLGDSSIAYNDAFRFFITTKMPNPHYPPEVAVKVSLVNFTITPGGLEDQMLGIFVVNELPALEERKNSLVLETARMKKNLKDIETTILHMLSVSTGNILDDKDLIDTLARSKQTSAGIKAQVQEAEDTEREIDAKREAYRPVAFRASVLYFCISELGHVDPMYQYSLTWFQNLFVASVKSSEPSTTIEERIDNLNDYFMYSVYRNVCRSLFERHKLLFSFLMCVKVLQGAGKVDKNEWRFLISGQGAVTDSDGALEQPHVAWIDVRMWAELQSLATLPAFEGLAQHVRDNVREWKKVFDSAEAHACPLPAPWDKRLQSMQTMCVLRCLRPDKMTMAVQAFVVGNLAPRFIEPPPLDLQSCFDDSSVQTPLIFILSTGSDPTTTFYNFADKMNWRRKVACISLGQGQGVVAAKMIAEAQMQGHWVLLQNCHLAISWMEDLERICEHTSPDLVSRDYRLWLTSMPTQDFPISVLQNGVKMTNEPPKGLKQNMKNFYFQLHNRDLTDVTNKPEVYRKLLFGLAMFHANVQERKKFGALGWNRAYEFNDSDLEISRRQLAMFLDEYEAVPYRVLNFLTAHINYGGRVTDDKDLRLINVILTSYFCPGVMDVGYPFSPSGVYKTINADRDTPLGSYMEYIDSLPLNAGPEVFGMHPNANITCDRSETYDMFEVLLSLQPRTASSAGRTREEEVTDAAVAIEHRLPADFDMETIKTTYPVMYGESMNTVLVQECLRYNKLLVVMKTTLSNLQKALVGQVVMSGDLEAMGDSLFDQRVPVMWETKSFPSLKPLTAWTTELLDRLHFVRSWVAHGAPACFWISGFFFPQAFLTGTMQNFARKYQLPIDTLSFQFDVLSQYAQSGDELHLPSKRPEDGCFIYGLQLEGARWDEQTNVLAASRPKELFTPLPPMHLLPVENRAKREDSVYMCPVYKILSRRGTLSTTGHSTNFVMFIELNSDTSSVVNQSGVADSDVWIKAGVAAFCALRY